MTNIEKRRLELLTQTRNMYSEKTVPPAIHPRYQAAYHSIYGNTEMDEQKTHNPFMIRVVIAVVIFSLFFFMNQQKYTIGTIDSQEIVAEVQKNLFSKEFPLFIEQFKFF